MTPNLYVIYKHTSPSGKSYIGQTKNIKQREAAHKLTSSKCTAFKNAIQKYGWEAFTHETLMDSLTLEQANKFEEQLIEEHQTIAPRGYNLRSGGLNQLIAEEVKQDWSRTRRGRTRSPEHQQKLNDAARARIRTPEHQSKLIEAAKRVKSAATRRKMSEANKGKPKSAEHRQKTREANLGKTRTTECNAKIQARNIGRRLYKNNTTAERKYFYPGGFTTVPLDSWTPVVKP